MAKRKAVVEAEAKVPEVKPKAVVKKTKSVSPKKAAVPKAVIKKVAKAVEKNVEKPVAVKRSSRAVKKVVETVEVAVVKGKKAPAKTKEAVAAKNVKPPKPKTSPTKTKKAPVTKVPKVAAPAKTEKAAPWSRKAANTDDQKSGENVTQSTSKKEEKATTSSSDTENRKRPKPVKEVVAAKKPRVEVSIPVRHTRGVGVALTMGMGDVGQLGLGPDVLEKSRPSLVESIKDVTDVLAGGMHTVCLTSQGQVYTFGCNDEGALGRDTGEEGGEFNPGVVSLPGKTVHISAGDSHSAALLEDGRVFIWGTFRDSHGTMGLNSNGSQKLPVQILEGIPVTRIASGSDHFVCLSTDGHVYTCGCAEQGQLGRVAEVFSNRGGRKGKDYLLTPQVVALGKGKKRIVVDDIWTGSYCTFVRAKDTGLIYVFGLNNYNQLGLPSVDTRFQPEVSDGFKGHRWQSISCGQHHTLALDEHGKVYSLGRKEYGRLGMGSDATDLAVPTPIPTLAAEKCIEVAAGEAVSLAVTESGFAYSWGMGTNGQLGLGNDEDVLEPTCIKGKQLENKQVIAASAGGQHTVLLAIAASSPAEKN